MVRIMKCLGSLWPCVLRAAQLAPAAGFVVTIGARNHEGETGAGQADRHRPLLGWTDPREAARRGDAAVRARRRGRRSRTWWSG